MGSRYSYLRDACGVGVWGGECALCEVRFGHDVESVVSIRLPCCILFI